MANINGLKISTIVANESITVVGFHTFDEGKGTVFIFDSQTLEVLE